MYESSNSIYNIRVYKRLSQVFLFDPKRFWKPQKEWGQHCWNRTISKTDLLIWKMWEYLQLYAWTTLSDSVWNLEQNISCRRLLILTEGSLEHLYNHLINILRKPKLSHTVWIVFCLQYAQKECWGGGEMGGWQSSSYTHQTFQSDGFVHLAICVVCLFNFCFYFYFYSEIKLNSP